MLVALVLFSPLATQPISAADSAWSDLPMPQSVGTVVDMAVSPYQTSLVYLLAFNNGHKVWRTFNDGSAWQLIYQTGSAGLSSIDRFTLARNGTLLIAGGSANGPACLKSIDQGQTFTQFTLPVAIDSTAGFGALSEQSFFFTSFDGSRSRVWRTADGSAFESTIISATPLTILELSPGFAADNNLIAAGADGNFYLSTDGGSHFSALQQSPLVGEVCLAFSADYSASKYIYAASTSVGSGIWRMKVGEPAWTRIDAGLPNGTMLSDIEVSVGGIIYAASSNQVNASNGGLVKKTVFNSSWETARDGLQTGTTLWGLQSRGSKLYSLDTANNRIVVYNDTLASPVELLSPQSGSPGIGTFAAGTIGGIDIVWRNPGGATGFQWQVSDSYDMSIIRFESTTATESARLKNLDPGTTYYWRVRAVTPSLSPWSAVWSFTTALGAPVLTTPAIGSTVQILQPPFQWQPSTGAKSYELMLSTSADFSNLTAFATGIGGNAWQPTSPLIPSTGYFWKVRAIGTNTYSPWSAVSAFTTSAPPTTSAAPTKTVLPTTTPVPTQTTTATAPPLSTSAQTPAPTQSIAPPITTPSVPGLLIGILIGMGCLSGFMVSMIIKTRKQRRD
ncbi:fibronectin type III domain-containing protein [Dehalogenimonas etheniformans]|uniref:Fibronectin type-III domain-containing protein n=1 Tax=Dehalogenimonas etheniformans TaxID=1536648 RepID=A0A2P5P7G7_9CHLR|nr:fibronectin type III domain-containing protein [Dehalogenimonas etheniformans]PPD58219.1 hypothetical protein JP09_005360 [Dehalogenimonas etheniformans]QNT75628.1 fibronectin type III domain-containing protein [Dehalogenimonas etheniformans]